MQNEAGIDLKRNMLDFFRILATIQVFLGHFVTHYEIDVLKTPVYFFSGVPVLFLLCGFLAAMSIEKKTTVQYWKNRFFRIVPAYWLCIIVSTICVLCFYKTRPTGKEFLIYLFTQFFGMNFYTGDWLRNYGVGVPNGVLWTITVQIEFFVLVPVLKRITNKKVFCIIGAAAGIVVSLALGKAETVSDSIIIKLLNVSILPYMYIFFLGILAWLYIDKIKCFEKYRHFFLIAYVVWFVLLKMTKGCHVFDGVLYNVISILLIFFIVFSFSFRHRLRAKIDLTYGFYLYHMIVLNVIYQFGFNQVKSVWQGVILFAVIAGITLIFAFVSKKIENAINSTWGKK